MTWATRVKTENNKLYIYYMYFFEFLKQNFSNRFLISILYKIWKNWGMSKSLNTLAILHLLFVYLCISLYFFISYCSGAIVLDNRQVHCRLITIPQEILECKVRWQADKGILVTELSFHLQISECTTDLWVKTGKRKHNRSAKSTEMCDCSNMWSALMKEST